jgi:hypothetical protein
VSSLDELTPEIIGNCNVRFLYCPKCTKKVLPLFWEERSRFPWCLSLSCGTCKFIWMTCKVCTRIKSHFCFGSDLLRYHKEKHHSDAKSPTKRLLVKQDVEDVDVKFQKLSNTPVDKSTMKQSLDNQKVNDADDDPSNLSSSSINMPTMKQLLAKHHVEDLPNLSTIIEIPTCQEPDAVGVEEVNPKLGEEPTLQSSFTGIMQGYSDPHVSSAFLNDNVDEVDPKLGKPMLESSFTGIMQGYSDPHVSSAFLNDNVDEVDPKLGKPMLESSFTGIMQGYSDPHVSSAFLNVNLEEVDPKLSEEPMLESSFTGIMQGYSDHLLSFAFHNDNDSEFSESTQDDTW